jgi:hypothetical protein
MQHNTLQSHKDIDDYLKEGGAGREGMLLPPVI